MFEPSHHIPWLRRLALAVTLVNHRGTRSGGARASDRIHPGGVRSVASGSTRDARPSAQPRSAVGFGCATAATSTVIRGAMV